MKGGLYLSDIVTEKELCTLYKISTTTAYNWRKKGLPYLGKGKGLRYSLEAVKKWLEAQNKD